MFLALLKRAKYIVVLIAILIFSFQPAWAAGPPAPSIFSNDLAVVLIILMVTLLIVIGILANILIGAADIKRTQQKKELSTAIKTVCLLLFLLPATSLLAQDANTQAATVAKMITGMSSSAFYLMITVIFIELLVIIVMLIYIRLLVRTEKEKLILITEAKAIEIKKTRLSWWDRFNKLRPVSQEADLDLGHDYDGIRELDNKLPPWWLYGFYLTIVFAAVYLWRFHISHNGPSSKQEYETSIARAEIRIKDYLKAKGDAVDENTVTVLTAADDLAEGKIIYMKSCASCHTETGAGNVGPNLTDDFWMNGNDIKSIFKTIRYGINAMPQWQNAYSNKELAQVASYVKSLRGSNPPNAKAPQGIEMKEEMNPVKTDSTKKIKSSAKTVQL